MNKQVNLKEYIESYGYTIKEWDEVVSELCAKGIGSGNYQDYNLLQLVIGWLCNYNSEITKEE